MTKRLSLCVLSLGLLMTACNPDEPLTTGQGSSAASFDSEIPLAWNELYLEIERFTPGYRPPVSARTLGYIGLAAYECVQPGTDGQHGSLRSYYEGLALPSPEAGESYHWGLALTATYERMFELMMPEAPAEHLFRIYSLRTDFFSNINKRRTRKLTAVPLATGLPWRMRYTNGLPLMKPGMRRI